MLEVVSKKISVNGELQGSKVGVIVESIKQGIEKGHYLPGSQIPSIRKIASLSTFSNFTVVEALEILKAERYIISKPGKGFFVSESFRKTNSTIEPSVQYSDSIKKTLLFELATSNEEFKPGCGFLPESWLPGEDVRQAFRSAFRQNNLNLSSYGNVYGSNMLRGQIRQRSINQGSWVNVNQIITCNSTLNAIDLLMRHLLVPGDTVMIDCPSYFNLKALASYHKVTVVEFPRRQDIVNLDTFRELVELHKPKVYLTSSVAHNPTGHSFSKEALYPLLSILSEHDVHLIEDGLYDELIDDKHYRMSAFFGYENASYISGFSKLLTANTRISYIISNPKRIEDIAKIKRQTGGLTSETTEIAIYRILHTGAFDRHLRRLRSKLAMCRGQLLQWLESQGFELKLNNSVGLFLWVKSPVDPDLFAEIAMERGIILAPGSMFSGHPEDQQCIRFNIPHSISNDIQDTLSRILEEMQDNSSNKAARITF